MKLNIERKWLVLLALGLGSLMAALDSSVVNTVLPVLQTYFNSDVATMEWVITVYMLMLTSMLLTFGRLGDIHGHKKFYIAGFGLFIASSVFCATAVSPIMLIVSRGVQAIGGAMLIANSAAIVTGIMSPQERGKAFGLISMMTYTGLMIGPSLGGWLAQATSWRSIFFINIPVGLAAMTLGLIFIPKDEPVEQGKSFDLLGAGVVMVGLSALLLGLNKGAEWGWNSAAVLGSFAIAVIFLLLFIRIEKRAEAPMLDLKLFQNKLFATTTISAILNYVCVYSLIFLMPFFLIQGRGMNSAQAGLILTVQPIIMAITAPISGALSDKIGSRKPGMLGMAVLAAGLIWLSTMQATSPIWQVVLGLAIAGLGTGTFITPNTSALMGSAPRERQGIASGVMGAARNFGMVLGVGMAGAIFTSHLAVNAVDGLYSGISLGFMAAALVAIVGIFSSAMKEEL
ncbi:MAG: MFS transporter [Anaerolineaceae bacterium]|nr:MFS transporter [Anaerolineaceae bacterium]